MDPFLKGVLQGSIPVVVLVGGTHHIVKKLRETKPVLYWGSIIASAGLAFAIVQGKIPAPFMNAETHFVDCHYCGRNIDLYDETNDSISCDECGKIACGSYKCNHSKNPKETWEEFTCGECIHAETFEAPRKKTDFSDLPIQYKTNRMNSAICISKPDDSGDSLCGKAQFAMYCGTSVGSESSRTEISCAKCKSLFTKMTDEEKEKVRAYGFEAETFEDCEVCYTTVDKGTLNDVQAGRICDECYQMNEYAGGTGRQNNPPFSAETFEASGTKKPKLTPKQKQALDMMKYSYGANNNEYAYVEVDNRGWKPHRTRQVQALLNKGLIEIEKGENRNTHFHGYIENYKAYIVKLTPLAWEYKYEDPFGKYTPGSMYQQDGDKMV